MKPENPDFESITEDRRKNLARSIKEISLTELNTLRDSLFTDVSHPWRERFRQFIDENASSTFYHATTDDGGLTTFHRANNDENRILDEYARKAYFLPARDHYQAIYCRDKEKGFWFIPDIGFGILSPRSLKLMKEVVDER